MASVINTNIASLNAQRNLSMSQSSLTTALQRLSSGLRINSAKDDAAGLAIADRLTSQIKGLNQASRNANDGISLAQTAEGGLATATDLLQRMRELAVQSANSTNSNVDRASLQAEVSQLREEIDRVAKSTNFNGINLLDGSFTAQTFQVGANNTTNDRIQVNSLANMQAATLGSGSAGGSATLTSGTTATKALVALAAGDLTLNSTQIGATVSGTLPGQSADSAWALAQAINKSAAQSGVTAVANAAVASTVWATGGAITVTTEIAAGSFSINGVSVGTIKAGTLFDDTTYPPTAGGVSAVAQKALNTADAINKVSSQTGVKATASETGKVTLISTTGGTIDVKALGGFATLATSAGLVATAVGAPDAAVTLPTADAVGYMAGSISINGIALGFVAGSVTVAGQGANVAAAVNLISGRTGVTAKSDAITGAMVLTAADGRNIQINDLTGTGAGTQGTALLMLGMDSVEVPGALLPGAGKGVTNGTVTLSSTNPVGIAVGGLKTKSAGLNASEGLVAADVGSSSNSLSAIDIGTATGAQDALATLDQALAQIDSARGAMGALQNRFTSVVSNLASTAENLTASRSRIQDADFAAETANLTRAQILQQAGTAMLAQANALPNQVLALLK